MKKINSIWYGGTILGIGLLFAVAIPLLLYCISLIFGLHSFFQGAIRISIVIGVLILAINTVASAKRKILTVQRGYCMEQISHTTWDSTGKQ